MHPIKRMAYSTIWVKVLIGVLLWFGLTYRQAVLLTLIPFILWAGRIIVQGYREQHYASLHDTMVYVGIKKNEPSPVYIVGKEQP